jgi:type IV secretory pathway VirB10-like protein
MSETIEKTTKKPAAAKAAPKTEKKPAAKKAAPKAAAKPAAKKAAPKAEVAASSSDSLYNLAEGQMDATETKILSALNALEGQIGSAREIGSDKAKAIVSGFGGETKMAELIEKLAGYMGEATAAGMTIGMSPMVIMAGTAKGVYKKITD